MKPEEAVLPVHLKDRKVVDISTIKVDLEERARLDELFYKNKDIIRNRSIILKLRPIPEKEDFNSKIDFLTSCGFSLEHLSKVYETVINPTYPSRVQRSQKE